MDINDVKTATDAELRAERERMRAITIANYDYTDPWDLTADDGLTDAEHDLCMAIIVELMHRYPDDDAIEN